MNSVCRLILCLACVANCGYSVNGNTNCDELGVNFYDKIGCARQKERDGCPTYDDCKYEVKPGTCLYNGHTFNDREPIDSKVKDGSCHFGCICTTNSTIKGQFLCAQGQCGHWSEKKDCYQQYNLEQCCGSERCEPSKATCEVDGHTYKEGERFYPKDKCTVCICTSDFNGEYDGPYCKRSTCAVEIHHAKDIENNCAPLYYKRNGENSLCCPAGFMCPLSTDEVKESSDSKSNLSCKYGSKTYTSGTTITRTVDQYGKKSTITCECKLPPLMTCTSEL